MLQWTRLLWRVPSDGNRPTFQSSFSVVFEMIAPNEIPLSQRVSHDLLPYVRKPGQYIGQEINGLVKPGDWANADVRVVIGFPDTYALGMSHLGCQILYWLCNHTPGVCAERTYCPELDAEQRMRDRRIPLFTWDSRQPVGDCDIFAVSLQYEMVFTSFLTMLDLAGIPFRRDERDDSHPLVIVGGPQADNPEPVADFVDLVVMGDGEESMASILRVYKELQESGVRRRDMIEELARRFEWIYAPGLYDVTYRDDGTVRAVTPNSPRVPSVIQRCKTMDFEEAPFPLRPLVPYADVIHDRIAVEIMRGCPQRCRFCHAGYTKRPLGLRSVDKIVEIADSMWRSTGIDELGLLSLSTADYPQLRELTQAVAERFHPRGVNISVPSLRVDKMLANIPQLITGVRKGGLTIAVEAANDDMRRAIRKKVTDGHLLDGVRAAFGAGWKNVKLYFMTGFPGERSADVDGIYDLSRQVSEVRREFGKPPASVTASVGWLVPKPYTPFQWAAQPEPEYFWDVRRRLRDLSRSNRGAVKVRMHNIERSGLEAVFARGDRRLSPVVASAWRLGARLDGWDEHFKSDIWKRAFEEVGIDPGFYAHRERDADEVFPWSHLNGGPPTPYLRRQYEDVFRQIAPSDGVELPVLSA